MSMVAVKSKVTVSICDETYFLVADENEEQIIQAAEYLDSIMRPLIKAGVNHREKAAVLAALQCACFFLKSNVLEQKKNEAAERLLQKIDLETQLISKLD